ncbi:MAG: peptide-methionine (S)-S-oxide reductase MsrA [Actinomycetota bacterium]
MTTEQATFAAGCFWQVEASFRQIPGVKKTTVGYTGGRTDNPSYEAVCSHTTGHAEAVLVEFDPDQVSYDELLAAFWQLHDPTQLNRQGPDVGDQYRSAIFFHSPEQEIAAKESMEKAQADFSKPIMTEVTAAETFWPAEEYHQRYLERRGLASCALTVDQ